MIRSILIDFPGLRCVQPTHDCQYQTIIACILFISYALTFFIVLTFFGSRHFPFMHVLLSFPVPCFSSDILLFFSNYPSSPSFCICSLCLDSEFLTTKKDTKNPFQFFDVFLYFSDLLSQMIAPGILPGLNFFCIGCYA